MENEKAGTNLCDTSLLVIQLSFAGSRQKYLCKLIDSELKVQRLNKQIKARDPELLLRLAELYLERARVMKEIENKVSFAFCGEKASCEKK